MTRETLLDQAIRILQRAEFIISEKCDIRPRSFDVGARRGKTFLLIKVLSNIEGLGEDTSREMRRLAVLFSGTPIVIGEHTNDHPLEGGRYTCATASPASTSRRSRTTSSRRCRP